ncbi:unnamed protein product [Microthlaspi erraticum]|uniref:DUF3700 domain-containing protein n=1 Tax=Microthlaspi erraticum TaxID=1685480 RepID=A0A6D2HUP4_9BRAS|nr:unnamed protein product [Microthlaspi erraticum]
MLAIFKKSIATIPLPEYVTYAENSVSAIEDDDLVKFFAENFPESFAIDMRPSCYLRATPNNLEPTIPRLFAAKDDIFCIFQGKIDNLGSLEDMDINEEEAEPVILIDGCYLNSKEGPGLRMLDAPEIMADPESMLDMFEDEMFLIEDDEMFQDGGESSHGSN